MVIWSLVALLPTALCGFDPRASNNIAIYWDTPVNIIPLAFLTTIKNPTSVNFANAGDNCTTFPGTQLLRCPQIDEATTWASTLWSMFGPPPSSPTTNTTTLRPFGAASVDGFDMDLEAPSSNMAPFASALRQLMDASSATTGRRYYLSAAPQCPFPDAAMREMLEQVAFDFVSVQFYNNYCGAQGYVAGPGGPGNFNFARWISAGGLAGEPDGGREWGFDNHNRDDSLD
ncbi:hypothetical protein NEMBOFW57_006955 [Staphylotrichum longicolle]|uniref:chitinase n=1 Tax=Staphylotrichum longicolle TaxID=669026 RepID=A0AAD4ETW4_9PEZI|nr:hypothetical protein NEMBOFW57_006955 [Staphylotrichum longicolle]